MTSRPRGGGGGRGSRGGRGRAKLNVSADSDWQPKPQHHQRKAAAGSGTGDEFVITESTHLCGYPNCGKRFRFKHDLLRHQTKYHGRQPVRGRKSAGEQTGYFDE